jgi:L-threonylcarbamoyladenylate synthase
MRTKVIDISYMEKKPGGEQIMTAATEENLAYAAKVLRSGGLVAFPTETVYGLGADALNEIAVKNIYKAKGRPSDNPIIVHVGSASDVELIAEMDERLGREVELLSKAFWPGPLTVILPKKQIVPQVTTGGLDTVAVRMPDNPVAVLLIKKAGCPVAAPSANISGRPSPTKGSHVVADLSGRVNVIIRNGDCPVGIESTVLDLTGAIPTVLRPGVITPAQISAVLKKDVEIDRAALEKDMELAPKAPGMKYTHYAPKAEMLIIKGEKDKVAAEMEALKRAKEAEGLKVGIIQFTDDDSLEAARQFFAKLRELDDESVDIILASALDSKEDVAMAVMNRMLKAAGYKVLEV